MPIICNSMTIEEIKSVSIVQFLESQGYHHVYILNPSGRALKLKNTQGLKRPKEA